MRCTWPASALLPAYDEIWIPAASMASTLGIKYTLSVDGDWAAEAFDLNYQQESYADYHIKIPDNCDVSDPQFKVKVFCIKDNPTFGDITWQVTAKAVKRSDDTRMGAFPPANTGLLSNRSRWDLYAIDDDHSIVVPYNVYNAIPLTKEHVLIIKHSRDPDTGLEDDIAFIGFALQYKTDYSAVSAWTVAP